MNVTLVTDSTVCFPDDLLAELGERVIVVPLTVLVDDEQNVEGDGIDSADVSKAQRHGTKLSTSRPTPARMLVAYQEAARRGAEHIVSVHVSAELSSTVSSAHLAAAESPVPVTVVDSGTLGMAMGFGVMAGVDAAAANAEPEEVAECVRTTCDGASSIIYVDSLDPLRRGGRIGRAGALLGSALAIRPLLTIKDGVIAPLERVRSSGRAVERLCARTVEAVRARAEGRAGPGADTVAVAIHGLERGDLVDTVIERVTGECADVAPRVMRAPLGAVVTTHIGAGAVAVVVATLPNRTLDARTPTDSNSPD